MDTRAKEEAALLARQDSAETPGEFDFLRARARWQAGRVGEAAAIFRDLLRSLPEGACRLRCRCHEGLARVAQAEGDFSLAIEEFEAALAALGGRPEYRPQRVDVLIRLADLYARSLGMPEEAVERLRRAAALGVPPATRALAAWTSAGTEAGLPPWAEPIGELLDLLDGARAALRQRSWVQAGELAGEAARRALLLRQPGMAIPALLLLAEARLGEDGAERSSEAMTAVVEARALAMTAGFPALLPECDLVTAGIALRRRDVGAARTLAKAGVQRFVELCAALTSPAMRRGRASSCRERVLDVAGRAAALDPALADILAEAAAVFQLDVPERSSGFGVGRARLERLLVGAQAEPGQRTPVEPATCADARRMLHALDAGRASASGGVGLTTATARADADEPGRAFVRVLDTTSGAWLVWTGGPTGAGAVEFGSRWPELVRIAQDWQRQLGARRQAGGPSCTEGPAARQAARQLFDVLAAPVLAAAGPGLRHLVVLGCPGDALGGLPWHALADGNDRTLLDVCLVSYAPSRAAFFRSRVLSRQRATQRGGFTAFYAVDREIGDEDHQAEQRRSALEAPPLRPKVRQLVRPDELPGLAAPASVLVFLGHCEEAPGLPALAALRLGDGRVVRAYELATLRCPRARLAILAACSSLREGPQPRDAGSGPVHALLAAGVPAVIGCGWPVFEPVARRFLHHFFEQAARKTVGAAWREAVRQLRSEYPASHDWAAFFLCGATAGRVPAPVPRRCVPGRAGRWRFRIRRPSKCLIAE